MGEYQAEDSVQEIMKITENRWQKFLSWQSELRGTTPKAKIVNGRITICRYDPQKQKFCRNISANAKFISCSDLFLADRIHSEQSNALISFLSIF